MTNLSVAIIAKNNEAILARLLASLQPLRDALPVEVVVLDTGSTDRTREVATEAGCRVESYEWRQDFAHARNAALDACRSPWLMWADTDEVFSEDACDQLAALVPTLGDVDVVYTSWLWHPTLTIVRERLFRAAAGCRWEGAVHEVVTPPDWSRVLRRPDIVIEHRQVGTPARTDRNITILEAQLAAGNRTSRNLFYYGNELRERGRLPEAAAAYREYLQAPSWPPERHQALLHLAACTGKEQPLHDAIKLDPSRAEGWVRLAQHYGRAGKWEKAIPCWETALCCPRPSEGMVAEECYSEAWLRDCLATAAHKAGRNQRALRESLLAIRAGSPEADRLRGNLRHYL